MKQHIVPGLAVAALVLLLALASSILHGQAQLDNILPEIVGFCLDGIFLVIIVGYYQKLQEKKRAELEKSELINTLSHFIKDNVWWLSVGAVNIKEITQQSGDTTYMVPVVEQAKKAIKALEKGHQIPAGMIDAIKRYGKESIMLKSMLPVAAQINGSHVKAWFNIIRSLDDIIDAQDEQQTKNASLQFLKKVVAFREAS